MPKRDYVLDFILLMCVVVGLFSLFSVSIYFFKLQLLFVIVSVVIYFITGYVPLDNYKYLFPIFYVFILFSLLYLFIFGQSTRGSVSWISLGFFNFQPSEFAKIVVIYYMSYVFSSNITGYKKTMIILFLSLPLLFLIFIQPDFGTFFLLFLILLGGFYLYVNKIKYFIALTISVFLAVFAGFYLLQDYQVARLTSFLDPATDPLGSGYNVIQSTIAVGSGGLFGKGYNQNTQVIYGFLPEPHTDFIFAAVSESYGFFYSLLVVLLLFTVLVWVFNRYVYKNTNTFSTYFAFGVFILLFTEIILNIGMNIGIMPITGLPLPFISYGGSSLLTLFILFGFLQGFYSQILHK